VAFVLTVGIERPLCVAHGADTAESSSEEQEFHIGECKTSRLRLNNVECCVDGSSGLLEVIRCENAGRVSRMESGDN